MRASTRLENKQNYGAICITYLFLIPKGRSSLFQKVFAVLSVCPEWHKHVFLVVIPLSFRYKKPADFMALRKGN